MAVIKPFKILHPKKEFVEEISCPPYDVVNRKEAELYAKNPISFMHVIRAEVDMKDETENVYKKAKENLDKLVSGEYLLEEKDPVFYIYRQKMGNFTQTGLVACVSVKEYDRNIIKKHELTRQEKEDDRTNHILSLKANTGPVFLTYPGEEGKEDFFDKLVDNKNPLYDFKDENEVIHTIYRIDDTNVIEQIKREFEKIPYLYIADGHHRAAAASRVAGIMGGDSDYDPEKEYNYFLSVIFPSAQLNIMDYNRIVKDLNSHSIDKFLKEVGELFEIYKEDFDGKPDKKHHFGMYLNEQWHLLIPKKGTYNSKDPILSLDVSILQNNLLNPILGIRDPRKDERIDFVGGIKGTKELKKLVDSGKYKVAFSLFPTSIYELMDVADSGKTMPPKSTWFEPKLRSGLFIHKLQ